jgi:transketolase N-terminal domain/subunit
VSIITLQLFKFLSTLKEHPEKDLFSVIEATQISLGIQISIGQEMQVIDGLLLVIAFLRTEI